jgi:hypothetical protein
LQTLRASEAGYTLFVTASPGASSAENITWRLRCLARPELQEFALAPPKHNESLTGPLLSATGDQFRYDGGRVPMQVRCSAVLCGADRTAVRRHAQLYGPWLRASATPAFQREPGRAAFPRGRDHGADCGKRPRPPHVANPSGRDPGCATRGRVAAALGGPCQTGGDHQSGGPHRGHWREPGLHYSQPAGHRYRLSPLPSPPMHFRFSALASPDSAVPMQGSGRTSLGPQTQKFRTARARRKGQRPSLAGRSVRWAPLGSSPSSRWFGPAGHLRAVKRWVCQRCLLPGAGSLQAERG